MMGPDELVRDEGFSVVDEVEVGTMEDVKEQRTLLPPTKGVKLVIDRAKSVASEDKAWRGINLFLKLVDGLEVQGEEGTVIKYKNAGIGATVCYYADTTVYTKDYFKNKQHLVDYKALRGAVELSDPTKVNDTTFQELVGQTIIANITQSAETQKDDTGKRVKTGNMVNEVRGYKKVEVADLV